MVGNERKRECCVCEGRGCVRERGRVRTPCTVGVSLSLLTAVILLDTEPSQRIFTGA